MRSWFATFVRLGVNINATNTRGETPIFNLNNHLPLTTGKAVEQESAAEAILWFEESGADLFARDNSGNGLLHIAAMETEEPVDPIRMTDQHASTGTFQKRNQWSLP